MSPYSMPVRLSIITPVYNGERFIASCVGALGRERPAPFEHVIVDDGSTDATPAILERYAHMYTYIRVIRQLNRGQSDAMNTGLDAARGSIVSFVNHDDFYEPGAVKRALQLFENLPDPSIVVGNCRIIDDDGETLAINRPQVFDREALLRPENGGLIPVNPTQYFYHRSLHDRIGPYDVDEHYMMDLDFWLRAVCATDSILYVDELFGNYRLIRGTKTYQDIQAGTLQPRFEALLRRHRRELPWRARGRIARRMAAHRAEALVRRSYSRVRSRLAHSDALGGRRSARRRRGGSGDGSAS
jgi:glycosyltransferase involved in cell wall biosynthesis